MVAANAICPNASAVPRLIAPSAPASRAGEHERSEHHRQVARDLHLLAPRSSTATSDGTSAPGSCSVSSASAARRPPSALQSPLAMLARVVGQRARPPGMHAARREVESRAVLVQRRTSPWTPLRRGQRGHGDHLSRARTERAQRGGQVASGAHRHLAEVGLGDDQHVRDLHDARLQELQHIAAAGLDDHDDRVRHVGDIGLGLPDADRLDHDDVDRRRPAPEPRRGSPMPAHPAALPAAVERMSTPRSAGSKSTRARSPSSEPPERRELGSTASIATVLSLRPPSAQQRGEQRRLTGAGRPRDADDVSLGLAAEHGGGDLGQQRSGLGRDPRRWCSRAG